MKVRIEPDGFASATEEARAANLSSALVCESLAGKLSGHGGMAGDDATSAQFAGSYDEGAREALATLTELTHAFIGIGRLVASTGANHARAEAASAGVAAFASGAFDTDDFVRVAPGRPPSSLGHNPPSLGMVETFVIDHVEGFVWPGADVALLLDAGFVWRQAAQSVAHLDDHCASVVAALGDQVSPEIPLALDALADLRALIGDTVDAFVALGAACEDYADAVRTAHDRTRGLLTEIGQMVVEGVAISLIVGGLTGGLGAGATGTATLARISAQAPRFHALLTTLRATGTVTAGRLKTAREGLSEVRERVEKFARVPARNERGSLRLPGSPGPRKPGWLRAHEAPPGHTLDKHVGKSVDELMVRCRDQGIAKASSFQSETAAERLIDRVLLQNEQRIGAWLREGGDSKLELHSTFRTATGTTVDRLGNVSESTGVRVVLIPNEKIKDGWQILTAFPS